MGRRHRSKTGDGGGERRLAKRREKEENDTKQQAPDLVFHDDPSSSDDEKHAELSSDFEEEELLPLDAETWSDEEEDEEEKNRKLEEIEAMGEQWGKSKGTFYSADTAEFEMQSDEEIAMEEEEAALELQQQELDELEDEDFNVIDVSTTAVNEETEEDVTRSLESLPLGNESFEKVEKDLSGLSSKEKLQVLSRSSPEIFGMIKELNETLRDLNDVVEPVVERLSGVDTRIDKKGLKLFKFKRQLYYHYCANLNFYLALKAKKQDVKEHPVIQHILSIKSLISQTRELLKPMEEQIQFVLSKDLEYFEKPVAASNNDDDGMEEFFFDDCSEEDEAPKLKKRKKSEISDAEKREAEEFYNSVQNHIMDRKSSKQEFYSHLDQVDMDDTIDSDAKRGATYQIIKNRGLTAHKKKLNRNPRVKKRVQYRKAVIRRKGQVRDVRTGEAGYYGGELTGIKSNITRSRKLRN